LAVRRRGLGAVLGVALVLAACSAESKPTAKPVGPVRIQFWHAMGGVNTALVNALVQRFNSSQTDVVVEAVLKADYDQTLTTLRTDFQGGTAAHLPALVQVDDIDTRFMMDSKQIVPVQDFIDREKFSVSDYEPNFLAYYRVNNRLLAMPFNVAMPLLYYNKKAFKDAGLDPEKPPKTFDEVAAAARTLTKKEGGRTTQYGMAIAVNGWFLEQLIAVQGAEYANNGNGRDKLATAVTFDNEAGVKALTWWKGMFQDGICANYGRPTANTQKAFDTGVAAMMIDSTAVLPGRIKGVAGKFEIGTGFLPRPADAKGGVMPGGAAVWILKGRPAQEQQAAWNFAKFITAPAQQAYWHIGTGYFPIRKAAYDDATDNEWRSKYPQFDTAIDQLHKTPVTTATKGALLGVFAKARQSVEGAIEKALLNQATPQQALREAADALKPDLEQYNRSVR
jgi:sn-glycerol 3-phosphate transport system substrate-binding protein